VTDAAPRFLAFSAARLAQAGLVLRPALPLDLELLAAIYATTRTDEMNLVAWSPEQKKAFTDSQSRLQESHYATHYPEAERLLVEREGSVIGRIYVDCSGSDARLMEITILPELRRHGTGTLIIGEFIRWTDSMRHDASLHVEPFNPAKRIYERMGFAVRETVGIYEFMVRPAAS
jgi:GNAT superfamily N-acetyltransferase